MADEAEDTLPKTEGTPLTWENIARAINEWKTAQGEYCGYPMPLDDVNLVLAPGHHLAEEIAKVQEVVQRGEPPEEDPYDRVLHLSQSATSCTPEDMEWRIVNQWYSRREQRTIAIVTNGTQVSVARLSKFDYTHRLDFVINTFAAFRAWSLEPEFKACEKLASLIPKHLWRAYLLTGTFIETSKRSRLSYVFRKLRPTIVLAWEGGRGKVLCTLCLHPIGYYEKTFAGSMCPTDEVIAHLLLMRGDEHLYWKRAEQHQPWEPESGL